MKLRSGPAGLFEDDPHNPGVQPISVRADRFVEPPTAKFAVAVVDADVVADGVGVAPLRQLMDLYPRKELREPGRQKAVIILKLGWTVTGVEGAGRMNA